MNAFVIDAFEFCRHKERRQGEIAVADSARLAGECADKSAVLSWMIEGGTSGLGFSQLTLSVSGSVSLLCQRCLTPCTFDIASESILILAKDDAHADEIEAMQDDDTIDVIVGSKALDLVALIEDEALLAMPLSAKHEVCPDVAALDALNGVKKSSPFDVLKRLS
ncbi:DUF177 domain-containing protein [Herminiimonas sp. CN]|uniref:YceD family protein n=1 Tax=Herminiimonas sp. CN TaxID=1349818 RepID=UPI000473C9D3|nr:DUF177 domain-containing protein [Herminiimonas sp. CN]